MMNFSILAVLWRPLDQILKYIHEGVWEQGEEEDTGA